MTQPTTPTTLHGGTPAASTLRRGAPAPRDRRPLATVMFAVIAVGLVVAGGTLLQLQRADHDAAVQEHAIVPADYALQATTDVSRLAELTPVSTDALGPLQAADAQALATLELAIADAVATLEQALADAALPSLGEAGADLDVPLDPVQDVPVPDLPVPDIGLDTLRLRDIAVSASPVGAGATTPLDEALAQVEGLQAQLNDLVGGSPVGDLVQGLPAGVGPIAPPLGGSPTQVNEADDAVEPDEEGASSASAHAQAAIALATGTYGSTLAEIEALLALYEDLVAKVEDALELVAETREQAEGDLETLLEERLAALEDKVAGLEAEADRLVDAHGQAVEDARGVIESTIAQARAQQAGAVRQAAEDALRALDAQAAALQAEAEDRRQAIDGIVATAAIELGEGAEAEQALQAIQSAATAADVQVGRELATRLAALEAQERQVTSLVEDTQADVDALAASALAEANVTLAGAIVDDEAVRDHLVAVAQEYGVQMALRETAAVAAAVDLLEEQAQELVVGLVEDAMQATEAPQGTLEDVSDVVGDAEASLLAEVGKDVDYVAKVGKDYGRVPTEDRKERAAHWTGLALDLEDSLQQVILDGQGLESMALDALAAAEQAQAQLESLA